MGATWSDSRPLPEGSLPPRYGTVERQRHETLVRLRAELVEAREEIARLRGLIGEHAKQIDEPSRADLVLWGT